MNKFLKYLFFLLFFIAIYEVHCDDFETYYETPLIIQEININRENVCDNELPNISDFGKLVNALHFRTQSFVIKQELLFDTQRETTLELVKETERNLRTLGIFTNVYITLDSLGYDTYKANIRTIDNWSTYLTPYLTSGGGSTNYGFDFEEFNLLGTGTRVKFRGLYRNESKIGWEGTFVLFNSRFPGTDLQDSISIITNGVRTSQQAILQVPFRTLSSEYSTGLKFINNFGKDFHYKNNRNFDLIYNRYKSLDAWYSRAFWDNDQLFMTGLISANKAKRFNNDFRQAFDNSGYVLLNFASIAQHFDIVTNLNSYPEEDLIYGGYGSATIGKIFPLTSDGDNLYYVSGAAEKSFYNKKSYIFLRAAGGSGFMRNAQPRYTYQESYINGFHRFSNKLVVTGRFSQQTVWNWPGWRQLILDNDNGLRGVPLNDLSGENRMFWDTELRYFIDKIFLGFNYSFVAFFDIGTVWTQEMQIYDAKFRKSVGLGLRMHFSKSRSPYHTWRIDVPYNFETKQFSVVFITRQFFPAFTNHAFTIPDLLGRILDID
ncbi:MAG: hypothetical protein A2X64_00845 [Ignavibacteria bacterium GWF2_33_9]|nr:MAG: hypothetical protein A2X64_00845 [Ignavibacteria bacterium GWF2_33_9]